MTNGTAVIYTFSLILDTRELYYYLEQSQKMQALDQT